MGLLCTQMACLRLSPDPPRTQ
eukprot:COSAG01_NODE_35537_length_530_cov_1.535963_1_plen_21_part_01